MKLQYLAQVTKLLEEYDFQDKYKILLELEEELTALEQSGELTREILFREYGTPAQFVSGLIGTFDLSKTSELNSAQHSISDTADLLNVTSTGLEQEPTKQSNAHHDDDIIDIEPLTNGSQSKQSVASNNEQNKSKSTKSKPDPEVTRKRKRPFKIIFGIILTLCFFIAFLVLVFTIIISVGLLVYIDVQTAISLFLGILFLLLTILFSINFLKRLIYCIIEQELKIFRLLITLFFIFVFAFLSKIMISSTMETVNMYLTENIYYIQSIFASYNVDTSNINWQNMNISEYTKLAVDTVKSVL